MSGWGHHDAFHQAEYIIDSFWQGYTKFFFLQLTGLDNTEIF